MKFLPPKLFNSKFSWYFFVFTIFVFFLYMAVRLRIKETYLEDDLIWLLPFIADLLKQKLSLGELLSWFHSHELTLFDGVYLSAMIKFFAAHIQYYLYILFAVHVLNAYFLYYLLFARLKLKFEISFWTAFIFLTYYGHFHAYLWPVAAHHLLCVTAIFLILILYLKTEELRSDGKKWGSFYLLTLSFCLLASFLRLSILVLPIILIGHILYADKFLKKVSARFFLWLPVLVILPLYQLLVLALIGEGHGSVLNEFLGLFQSVLDNKDATTAFIIAGGFICFLLSLGGILKIIEKLKAEQRFSSLLENSSYILLFFPHLFVVALLAWINAYGVSANLNPLFRWHPMLTPKSAVVYWLLTAVVLIAFFKFLRYVQKNNRGLIVFAVLYACLQPYLLYTHEGAVSRYLIYYSAFFSLVISLALFEWLPEKLKFFQTDLGKRCCVSAVVLLAVVNIFFIHVRLQKSYFGDYFWSYDYIKYANLIKEDLKNTPELKAHRTICVENIAPVTYWDQWNRTFLGGTSVGDLDPFLMTMRIVLGEKSILKVNDCQGEDLVYTATDKTLIRNHAVLVEPFYHHMSMGLLAINQKDYRAASIELKKSVEIKPFVYRLFARLSYFNKGKNPQSVAEMSKLFRRLSAVYYDDDPKCLFIENMIQNEVLDYGVSLLLLGYAQERAGDRQASQTFALAKEIISQEDVVTFPFFDYVSDAQVRELFSLMPPLQEKNVIKGNGIVAPVEVEQYKGYRLYWFPEKYIAVVSAIQELNPIALKRGVYQPYFIAKTRHELKLLIDQSKPLSIDQTEAPIVEEYKGFVIKHDGNNRIIAKKLVSEKEAAFEALSIIEVRMIIDEYFKLP